MSTHNDEEVHTDWCWSHCPVGPPYDDCECPCHRASASIETGDGRG